MTAPDEPDVEVSLAENLVGLGVEMEPFFEQARGIKARMEAEGWSPTTAEQVAGTWLMGAISFMWASANAELR